LLFPGIPPTFSLTFPDLNLAEKALYSDINFVVKGKGKVMNRREFLIKSAQYAALGAAGMRVPGMIERVYAAEKEPNIVVANGGPGPAARAAVNAFGVWDALSNRATEW